MHVCLWWVERIPNGTSGIKTVEVCGAEGKGVGGSGCHASPGCSVHEFWSMVTMENLINQ